MRKFSKLLQWLKRQIDLLQAHGIMSLLDRLSIKTTGFLVCKIDCFFQSNPRVKNKLMTILQRIRLYEYTQKIYQKMLVHSGYMELEMLYHHISSDKSYKLSPREFDIYNQILSKINNKKQVK